MHPCPIVAGEVLYCGETNSVFRTSNINALQAGAECVLLLCVSPFRRNDFCHATFILVVATFTPVAGLLNE